MWLRSITNVKTSLLRLTGNNSRLHTSLLVFAGCLAVNLLVYGLLVVPARAKLSEGDARYAEYRRRHATAVLFEKQRSSVAGIMAGVPAQKDMPLLIRDLVQTARRLNLSVASVKYDIPKKSGGELAQLAFSFPAEGRYPDIKRFIYEVETSDRLVGIQNIKLSTEKDKIKMDMKLVTYLREQ